MSNNLIPVSDVQTMAIAVAKSGLFGMKTPEQALALMLVAQSEGLHPARAAMEYHVIQGRPALKADAMLARFQNAGGKVQWLSYTDADVTGEFSHPSGGSVKIQWTYEMATKAGLTKNPTWKQYPRAMLRARCISEGIRTVYPGVSVGIYTPEEVQDFAPVERDITPQATQAQPAPKPAPTPMPEKVKQAAAAVSGKRKPVTIDVEPSISGDPNEGNLNIPGVFDPVKPAQEKLDAMLAAFQAQLSMTQQQVEKECNFGPISEWTVEQFDEAREVFKALKVERASIQKGDEV